MNDMISTADYDELTRLVDEFSKSPRKFIIDRPLAPEDQVTSRVGHRTKGVVVLHGGVSEVLGGKDSCPENPVAQALDGLKSTQILCLLPQNDQWRLRVINARWSVEYAQDVLACRLLVTPQATQSLGKKVRKL